MIMSKMQKQKKRHIPDSKQRKLRGRNQSHGGNDPMCFIAWGTFQHFHPPLPGMQISTMKKYIRFIQKENSSIR